MKPYFLVVILTLIGLGCSTNKDFKELTDAHEKEVETLNQLQEVHEKLKKSHKQWEDFVESRKSETNEDLLKKVQEEHHATIDKHGAILNQHKEILQKHEEYIKELKQENISEERANELKNLLKAEHTRMQNEDKIMQEEHDRMDKEHQSQLDRT